MTPITRPAIRYLAPAKTFMARLAADYKNWGRGFRGLGDDSTDLLNLPITSTALSLPTLASDAPVIPASQILPPPTSNGMTTPLLLLGGLLLLVAIVRK